MSWLYEDSTLVIALGVLSVVLLALVFLKTGAKAALYGLAAAVVFVVLAVVVERQVVTNREQLEAMFEELAAAFKNGDAGTVMAAIDPAAVRVRGDAQQALGRVRLSDVKITDQRITLEPRGNANTAEVDVTVRVSGNERGGMSVKDYLGRFLVQVRKLQGRWLIQSYAEQPIVGKAH